MFNAKKPSEKTITQLNEALKMEFISIKYYNSVGIALNHWGIFTLGDLFVEESIEENKHVKLLINRILELGGNIQFFEVESEGLKITKNLKEIFEHALKLEEGAIKLYKEIAVRTHDDEYDIATSDIVTNILRDEENHRSWILNELDLMKIVGESLYISTKLQKKDC